MLTDEDLTRELASAFRDTTADLSYHGRTRPPVSLVKAVPPLVVAASVAALAVNIASQGSTPAPDNHPLAVPSSAPASTPAGTPTPSVAMVTETLKLAGFTMRYERAATSNVDPVRTWVVEKRVPGWAHEVAVDERDATFWVGTNPSTGDHTLFIQVVEKYGGRIFAMASSTMSEGDLVAMVRSRN